MVPVFACFFSNSVYACLVENSIVWDQMYAVCINKIPLQLFQIQTTVCLWASFPWELKVQTQALTWKSINVRNKNKTRIYRCSTIYKSSTFIGKLTLNVLFHFDLVSLSFMITVFLYFFLSPRPIICLNGRLITRKKKEKEFERKKSQLSHHIVG